MVVEQVLQENDAHIDGGDDVNDQKRPFDGQEDGILVRHSFSGRIRLQMRDLGQEEDLEATDVQEKRQ